MSSDSTPQDSQSPESTRTPENARRRMLKGGFASAPVLLTLASRPVLGSVYATTASAFSSLNASAAAGTQVLSNGRSPSTWSTTNSWPSPYKPNGIKATRFISSTTQLAGGPAYYSDKKVSDILALLDNGGTQSLAIYTAAALLNAAANLTPVLNAATVRDMWNSCVSVGYYEPTSGVQWGPSQIVTYIQSTIG